MHWLMKCFPSDENMDWGSFGIFTFDEAWLRQLWKLEAAFKAANKRIRSMAELVVWDYSITFYDRMSLTPDQESRLDKYDYIECELGIADDEDRTRTECETLHMIDDAKYIYWSVIVKHSDVRIDTPRIALADFECEIHGRDPRKKRTCLKCLSQP